MQFIKILKSFLHGEIDSNQSLFCFYGPHYPGLFFSQFFSHAKKKGLQFTTLHLEDVELADFFAAMQMSFLGQKTVFWCPGLVDCAAAKKKELTKYLVSYAGPHRLIVWSDQSIGKNGIELPPKVDQKLFKELWQLLYPETELAASMLSHCCGKESVLDWDASCMLMQYMQVVASDDSSSSDVTQDLRKIGEKIIAPEKSLFTLSQHFFAKNQDTFLAAWRAVEPDFPPEFWTVFWSEQLWQASLFVDQALQVGPQAARKGINRLPFSFMQKDWRGYSAWELCAAHNFLYGVDYGMKNGHAAHGLELFLMKFLQSDFQGKLGSR